RGVGHALAALGEETDVPWWRVINRNGEISIRGPIHGPALQRALLEREGVRFLRGRIDWRRFGWNADGLPDGMRGDPDGGEPAGPQPVRKIRRRRR
ncbi:MAG: MGMT family protein, partial [Gemmatimonadota bacterium]